MLTTTIDGANLRDFGGKVSGTKVEFVTSASVGMDPDATNPFWSIGFITKFKLEVGDTVLKDLSWVQQDAVTTTSFFVRFASTRFPNGSSQKIKLTVSYLLIKYSPNGNETKDTKLVENVVHEYDFVPYNAGFVNATAEYDLNNVFVVDETNIVPTVSRAVSSVIAGALPTVNHSVTPSARTMDDKMRKLTSNMPAGQKGLLDLFRESTFYGMCSHGILSGSNCVGLRSSRLDDMPWMAIKNAIGTMQNRTVPFLNLVILYACKGGSGTTASFHFGTERPGCATVGFDESVSSELLNPSQGNLDAHAQVLSDALLAGNHVSEAVRIANAAKQPKRYPGGSKLNMKLVGNSDPYARFRYVYLSASDLAVLRIQSPLQWKKDFLVYPLTASGD